LFTMFGIMFVKAEFLNMPYSAQMLDSIVLMIQIALGAIGIGHVSSKIMPGVHDFVNENRARKTAGELNHSKPVRDKSEKVEREKRPDAPANEIIYAGKIVKDSKIIGNNILFEWMTEHLGVLEVKGPGTNSTIKNWLNLMEWPKKYNIKTDEEPWCSLPIAAGCKLLGLFNNGKPNAKSWLSVGAFLTIAEVVNLASSRFSSVKNDYALLAIYHRNYIASPVNIGTGHVRAVGKVGVDGYGAIGGNESNQMKQSYCHFNDPMLIGFVLIEKQ